jgi:hypothetical protein
MKKVSFLLVIILCAFAFSCKKEKSERFILLTTPTWTADTLFANGVDASGPGLLLEKFKGDAKFREDGTGDFGNYEGTWSFSPDETKITIASDSLQLPIMCNIDRLTKTSLKVTTSVLDIHNPTVPISILMTFKAK